MIRVAAVADLHYGKSSRNRLRSYFERIGEKADLFVIAGDLTQAGWPEEAEALAHDLHGLPIPVVAVLGNHDYHQNEQGAITEVLTEAGIVILEGNTAEYSVGGRTVGVMGLKGFGGGFFGACITEFGEEETKAFARHARDQAMILRRGLEGLNTDLKVALTHFSPIEATLSGEPREIYPFLGSYLLAEAIDAGGAHVAFHGHAHLGTERGMTRKGVPVRNVAQTVIRHAYHIYTFERPVEYPQFERVSASQ